MSFVPSGRFTHCSMESYTHLIMYIMCVYFIGIDLIYTCIYIYLVFCVCCFRFTENVVVPL